MSPMGHSAFIWLPSESETQVCTKDRVRNVLLAAPEIDDNAPFSSEGNWLYSMTLSTEIMWPSRTADSRITHAKMLVIMIVDVMARPTSLPLIANGLKRLNSETIWRNHKRLAVFPDTYCRAGPRRWKWYRRRTHCKSSRAKWRTSQMMLWTCTTSHCEGPVCHRTFSGKLFRSGELSVSLGRSGKRTRDCRSGYELERTIFSKWAKTFEPVKLTSSFKSSQTSCRFQEKSLQIQERANRQNQRTNEPNADRGADQN